MTGQGLITLLPMLLLLCWAAAGDLRTRRIPNWLTLGLAAGGLLRSFVAGDGLTPAQSMLGLLAGFGLPLILFAIDALGGGDVKLLAAVGSWLGAGLIFQVFLAAAVLGMLIVVAQALWQRRLHVLLRNSALVAVNVAHAQAVGVEHLSQTGQSCQSVNRPLPYAVPVLAGVCLVLWMSAWGAG